MKAPITRPGLPNSNSQVTDSEMLDDLRCATFTYFRDEVNSEPG